MVKATIHPIGELWLRLIDVAGHPSILRAAAGEHEDAVGAVEGHMGKDAPGIVLFQVCEMARRTRAMVVMSRARLQRLSGALAR